MRRILTQITTAIKTTPLKSPGAKLHANNPSVEALIRWLQVVANCHLKWERPVKETGTLLNEATTSDQSGSWVTRESCPFPRGSTKDQFHFRLSFVSRIISTSMAFLAASSHSVSGSRGAAGALVLVLRVGDPSSHPERCASGLRRSRSSWSSYCTGLTPPMTFTPFTFHFLFTL